VRCRCCWVVMRHGGAAYECGQENEVFEFHENFHVIEILKGCWIDK
jgi:hypothetical protein